MAIRIPNPCDGVVDPSGAPPAPVDDAQGAQGIDLGEQEEQRQPIFSEVTIEAAASQAGRSLTMIDEEFFMPMVPPHSPEADFIDEDAVYTPAWFYGQKIQEAMLRSISDTSSFDAGRVDPFRAGGLQMWWYDADLGYQSYSFLNGENGRYENAQFNIPVNAELSNPLQNDLDLSTTTNIVLTFNQPLASRLTDNYSYFDGDREKFFNVYFLGERSEHYSTLAESPKQTYKYGLVPEPKSKYTDSVFNCPLPFHKKETDFLPVPAFNVVDISLESRGFLTEGFGRGKIVSEYQKPSIYRSFFEDKSLENLELNAIPQNQGVRCIPSDRVHKFPSDQVRMMETANEKLEKQSESFIRIKIATPQGQGNFIAQLLENNKMDRHVLDLLTSTEDRYTSTREVFTQVMRDSVYVPEAREMDVFTSNDRSQQGVFTAVNNNFAKKINDQRTFTIREQDITEYPMGYFNHDKPILLSFEDAITSQVFLAELTDHVKSRALSRNYNEILSGRKAHSEIIAFHVEKIDEATREVVQDFYFSDSNEVLEIDFVDNQILQGKKYRYRIYAVNIVLATEYTYNNPRVNQDPDNPIIEIPVATKLKYSIIETPYFEKVVSVFDKPPMFPQVSFIPYQGVEDEISFLLQDNGGEILELPISIRPEDQDSFTIMSEAQDKNLGDALLYGSDDLPTGFEALIMQGSEPHSYEDFADAEVVRFDANGKTGFLKMNINPNEYYYIVFRTVEGDMISNPTEVYRFMMVSYQNGIFLDVQTIEMEPPTLLPQISFESLLSIEPVSKHYFLNVAPESDSAQDMTKFVMSAPELDVSHIGEENNPLWGKNFKIRLKSRSTSKEIDIKMTFEKEVITKLRRNEESMVAPIPDVCDE